MGQFMTPKHVASRLVADLPLQATSVVLEPSFGEGSFLLEVIDRLVALQSGSKSKAFDTVMRENIFGVELDSGLYEKTLAAIEAKWGHLPSGHNLSCGDYFQWISPILSRGFDFVVGNPPFGGTFDASIEDALDRRYGSYRGHKLKKETYSFFTAKAIDELADDGRLSFICSDTFLTIKTMRGLRELLLDSGSVVVAPLIDPFSDTAQPMVVLDLEAGSPAESALIRGNRLSRSAMEATKNLSWGLTEDLVQFFEGPMLGEFVIATGGMTIGKNEWFVRGVDDRGTIIEPYEFEFFEEPITLEGELSRARLNRLSGRLRKRAVEAEKAGATRRSVRVIPREEPLEVSLPDPTYRPYNKSTSDRFYSEMSHVVYWENDGDAVLTFKKSGPWYLHGVGGQPYFGREGIAWQLVSSRLNVRYLPPGFILDSGAPCAFLREGVPGEQLFLILGWLQTRLATELLKTVINHTRNIQGKDVERLPYPHWVGEDRRVEIASRVERALIVARAGEVPGAEFFDFLEAEFDPRQDSLSEATLLAA
jgi:hypothetical protein